MSIHIHSLLRLFALISQPKFEPALGYRLNDLAVDPEGWENNIIEMIAQCARADSAQRLCCEIYAYVV